MTLIIHDNRSLKGKRRVVKKVVERLKGHFNVSVSEVGSHDLWGKAELGIAAVGPDRRFVNSVMDKVIDFVEELEVAEVAGHELEIVNY